MTDADQALAEALAADSAYYTCLAEKLAALEAVTASLAEARAVEQALYKDRVGLFLDLRALEVPYATVSAHTDAVPEAIRVAVNKALNPGRPSRPKAAT